MRKVLCVDGPIAGKIHEIDSNSFVVMKAKEVDVSRYWRDISPPFDLGYEQVYYQTHKFSFVDEGEHFVILIASTNLKPRLADVLEHVLSSEAKEVGQYVD